MLPSLAEISIALQTLKRRRAKQHSCSHGRREKYRRNSSGYW